MNYKAVIFDLDGVIVDTELYWELLNEELCRDLGIKNAKQFYEDNLGLNNTDAIRLVTEKYKSSLSEEEVRERYLKL